MRRHYPAGAGGSAQGALCDSHVMGSEKRRKTTAGRAGEIRRALPLSDSCASAFHLFQCNEYALRLMDANALRTWHEQAEENPATLDIEDARVSDDVLAVLAKKSSRMPARAVSHTSPRKARIYPAPPCEGRGSAYPADGTHHRRFARPDSALYALNRIKAVESFPAAYIEFLVSVCTSK